jgi:hypothetical protein
MVETVLKHVKQITLIVKKQDMPKTGVGAMNTNGGILW